jgi:hypothetical protein
MGHFEEILAQEKAEREDVGRRRDEGEGCSIE